MNCREFIDFLLDYFEGQLPPCQCALFSEHMAECKECVDYLKMYEQTIKLGKEVCRCSDQLPLEEVPEDLIQAILVARSSGH